MLKMILFKLLVRVFICGRRPTGHGEIPVVVLVVVVVVVGGNNF